MNSCLAKWFFARSGRFVVVFVVALLLAGPFQTSVNQAGAVQQTPTIYYTALGDSIASGHGLANDFPGDKYQGEDCRLSASSYPVKVGAQLGQTFGQELFPLNLACSGAGIGLDKTKDFENQVELAVADIDLLPHDSPILITISMGANNFINTEDTGDAGVVSNAIHLSREDYYTYIDTTLAQLGEVLGPKIGQLLAYPNVSILMVTYPSPVPTPYQHICTDLSSYAPACLGDATLGPTYVDPLTGGPLMIADTSLTKSPSIYRQTMIRLDYFISRLNEVVGQDIYQEYANTGRVDYTKELRDAFWDHECFTQDPWFQCRAELVFGEKTGDKKVDVLLDPVHPNDAGAQVIANQVALHGEPLVRATLAQLESSAIAPSTDTAAPPPAPVAPSGGYYLPWEAGSVWQITSDNNGGNHADQYNEYAFDAVPVAGRSTPNVTAIADGRVLGFQADVPNEALFNSGHAGNCMMIEHGDGSISLYAHLAAGSIPGDLRREGAEVRGGMVIGTVGNTGYASGVHLHWSLVSNGFMYDAEGYRTCAGTSIPSKYADNDAELIEDGGVPRTGRYYESTNAVSSAAQAPVQPTDPAPATCNDPGRPEQSARLSASPQDPNTTTEVMLSVTITNTSSCGTFAPTVLAIGGRDPAGNVTDPYQSRDFALAPGESRTLDVPVVLSSPGTHEFFMAHQSGGWHRIPDTSSDSSSIYVTVAEAASAPTEAPAVATEAPPAPTEVASDPGVIVPVDGAVPAGEVAPMDIGAGGPNGHEIGARFTVTTEDGASLGSCTLEGDAMAPYPLSCQVSVPRYSTVVVTLDESSITPGYTPVQNPITFDTSSEPGAASHWGISFQLEAQGTTTVDAGPVDIAIYTTENGTAAYDACYVLVDYSNVGCDENRDGKVTFAEIPFGTYTVRQTANLGPGRSVTDFTIQVSGKVNAEGYEPFTATIASTDTSTSTTTTITSTGGLSAVSSGSVDIALITRDPGNGSLLRDACYMLVDYSNEGCDENGDGQVTFADIPYGTYTVRQTQTPAGYTTVDDYVINVEPVTGMPGSGPFGVPLGFIVKQAPEQNAPNTRNVSVVFLDMVTHERVTTGACVELTGASNVGCDKDLVDGQVDFIDVPAGGPYELRFSNLPAGYEVGTVGGPLSLTLDAGSGTPSNRTVFVLVAGGGSGSGVTIEPVVGSASTSPQPSAGTGGVIEATVYMTFRGCPEDFVPDVTDPYTACTIPLDAPDAALVGEGGVATSFVPITGLERQYDGAYIFPVNSGGGYALALTGLEPVLRDSFHIYGVDDFDGSSYISQLKNGETREIFVFYYYE